MPGSTRQCWRIRRLLVVLCLLFAPPLDALDGDAEDVQVVAAEAEVASRRSASRWRMSLAIPCRPF